MSYILDALKKAERERDVARVPTLTTVHDMPTARSRLRFGIILGTCLVCAALLAWAGFLGLRPVSEPASAPSGTGSGAERAEATPTPLQRTETAPEQITPLKAPETKISPSYSASGKNLAAEAKRTPVLRQAQKETATPSTAAKELIPSQAQLKVSAPDTKEAPPATAPSKPLSLPEAISKMNMTILFYAEARSERMVFINGHKYFERDYIDGQYLIESITPEGAWLRFDGDRAILRAKSR
jgi:general secretion pathway protein B